MGLLVIIAASLARLFGSLRAAASSKPLAVGDSEKHVELTLHHHRCIFSRHKDIVLVPMAMRPSVFWTIAKARELYEKAHAGDNAARRSA